MKPVDVSRDARGFTITWNDRSTSELPFIWLRDNDPDELHPDTRERIFDLTTVSVEINPMSFRAEKNGLVVDWPGKDQPSVYPFDWLRRYQPGITRDDPSMALPLHTDLPNQEIIPGYQVLHCYRNSAAGGDSILADGFRVAEDLREEAPHETTARTAVLDTACAGAGRVGDVRQYGDKHS